MINKDSTLYDVVGIGNAIVDVLAKVGDGFLRERSLPKGGMTLVEAADAGKIYADLIPEREVSGGSAANTVSGLASLGSDCAFIGKVHDDELGQEFQRNIGAAGIDFFTRPLTEGPSTGRSIVLVTPDAERSMFTYLGASKRLTVADIDEETIRAAKITYLEGYLWDEGSAKEAVIKACELAHKHNRKVAFSLSDKSCLLRNKDEIVNLIKDHVDILSAMRKNSKPCLPKTTSTKRSIWSSRWSKSPPLPAMPKVRSLSTAVSKSLSKPKKSTTSSIRPVPAICMPPVFCMA